MGIRGVRTPLLVAAAMLPAVATASLGWAADPTYQPAVQGVPAAPVESGSSDLNGHVVPTSSVNPLPTMSFGDRRVSIPTVTAGAYSSGNDVGGLNPVSFQGGGPIALIENFGVKSLSGQTPALTVYLFDSQPQHSTFTDKGTFSLDGATAGTDGLLDIDRLVVEPFALIPGVATGTSASFAGNGNMVRIPHSGVATLWYALVAGGAFTPGSTADIRVGIQVVQQHQ